MAVISSDRVSQPVSAKKTQDDNLTAINYHACGLRNNNAALCTKARKPVESKPVRSRDG